MTPTPSPKSQPTVIRYIPKCQDLTMSIVDVMAHFVVPR
jgi:hypothetical protein